MVDELVACLCAAGFDRSVDRFLVPSYTWFCFVLRVFSRYDEGRLCLVVRFPSGSWFPVSAWRRFSWG